LAKAGESSGNRRKHTHKKETTTMTTITIFNDKGRESTSREPNAAHFHWRPALACLLGLAAILVTSRAQASDITISWQVTGHSISTGYLPKLASDGIQNVVTIDENGTGLSQLQDEIGSLMTTSVAWAGGTEFLYDPPQTSPQVGHAPSIALGYDSVDNYDTGIEVHQGGQDDDGALWYQIGSNAPPSFSKIEWSVANWYDTGYNPTVAADLNGHSKTSTTVVEVHQAGVNEGALWYHVGELTLGTTPSMTWGPATEFNSGLTEGYAPTVSVANNLAVLVAQGSSGSLWYSIGVVDPSAFTIAWSEPVSYASGYNPTVSVFGDGTTDYIGSGRILVEAHQAGSGTGPLVYLTGVLKNGTGGSGPTSIEWSTDQGVTYVDAGCYPSVALSFSGSTPSNLSLTETHEVACNSATTVQYSFGYLKK
jgi:hypothetical protein